MIFQFVEQNCLDKIIEAGDLLTHPTFCHASTTFVEGDISTTAYQWDPKNDFAVFVANQKSAWEASAFTTLEEESLMLELGLTAIQFTPPNNLGESCFAYYSHG